MLGQHPSSQVHPGCGHREMLTRQSIRIAQLTETLAALHTKFEVVNDVNSRQERQLLAEEKRRREDSLSSVKQLAQIEALFDELIRTRQRESDLEFEKKELEKCLVERTREFERLRRMFRELEGRVRNQGDEILARRSQAPQGEATAGMS